MTTFKSFNNLESSVNAKISIKGKISNTPWQHIISSLKDYPYNEYFDLEDGFQTVIYSKEPIKSKSDIIVVGFVIEVKGKSKRPRDDKHSEITEYHLVVEDYKILTEK